MKQIILTIAITFSACFIYAQRACVDPIKAYNERFSTVENPVGKTVYLMDYTTDFYYWDASMQSEHIKTKLYMGENHMHYYSNFVDIFTDEAYMATVFKKERKIIITLKPQNDPTFDNFKVLMNAREMILDSAKIVNCSKSGEIGKLTLDTRNLGFSNFYVEKMIYEYNLKTGDIMKTTSEYSDKYEIKKMIITNHEINLKSRYKGFKAVKEMLMKSNGELINTYKGYEIITN